MAKTVWNMNYIIFCKLHYSSPQLKIWKVFFMLSVFNLEFGKKGQNNDNNNKSDINNNLLQGQRGKKRNLGDIVVRLHVECRLVWIR